MYPCALFALFFVISALGFTIVQVNRPFFHLMSAIIYQYYISIVIIIPMQSANALYHILSNRAWIRYAVLSFHHVESMRTQFRTRLAGVELVVGSWWTSVNCMPRVPSIARSSNGCWRKISTYINATSAYKWGIRNGQIISLEELIEEQGTVYNMAWYATKEIQRNGFMVGGNELRSNYDQHLHGRIRSRYGHIDYDGDVFGCAFGQW